MANLVFSQGSDGLYCGDGYCNGDETFVSCPEDCYSDEFDNCNYCEQIFGESWDCCDMEWFDSGLTCAELISDYNWTCNYCVCPGDSAICEEQGLIMCDDYSCAETLEDCGSELSCEDQGLVTCPDGDCAGDISYCTENCDEGYVEDCHDENDCLLESWIGDGYPDCWPGTMWDLACYYNDGGDCDGYTTCEMQGLITCPNGECVESLEDCSDSTDCVEGYVTDCSDESDCVPESWIGDGWQDCGGLDTADLTCYDNDGGDCIDNSEYDIEFHIQNFEEDGTFELILVNNTDLVAFEFDIPDLSEPDWDFSDNFPTDGWMWAGYWLFYNLYNTPLPVGIYEINASGDLFNNEFCVDGSVFSNSTGEQITNVFFSECAFVECSNPGDINYDGAVDILDIVGFVNDILNPWISNELFHVCGDINEDDEYNVLDIVLLIDMILNPQPSEECNVIPEVGPCEGICPTYYYNQDTNHCEEFITGCCGVEAFDTMEDCLDICE